MFSLIVYLLAIFLEIFFFAGFTVFTIFLIYSTVKGSPYVPTKTKQAKLILEKARMKKNQVFLELGCGDGRVVRMAVSDYQVRGIGVEINPLLLFWDNLLARLQKLKNIEFFRLDIVKEKLPPADVIYIFLMPKLIKTITPKLKTQLEKGSLIISHGFKVVAFTKHLKFKMDGNPFPTYFYQL